MTDNARHITMSVRSTVCWSQCARIRSCSGYRNMTDHNVHAGLKKKKKSTECHLDGEERTAEKNANEEMKRKEK